MIYKTLPFCGPPLTIFSYSPRISNYESTVLSQKHGSEIYCEMCEVAQFKDLPFILTTEDKLSSPKWLSTLQVYLALSSESAPFIIKASSFTIDSFSPSITSTPSFVQVIEGVGTPLTGHLIVIVVFAAAVTLSPMFIVTGLPSPTGMATPGSGTLIAGLVGSVEQG